MVVFPNKPILVGVGHHQVDIDSQLDLIKEILKGKKQLFIELSPKQVADAIKLKSKVGYGGIAILAHSMGVKVIPLDKQMDSNEVDTLMNELSQMQRFEGGRPVPPSESDPKLRRALYVDHHKREKYWESLLSGKGAESVVIMYHGHAKEMQKVLNIPKDNAFLFEPPWYRQRNDLRHIADQEKSRIEKERLERKRRHAQQRRH